MPKFSHAFRLGLALTVVSPLSVGIASQAHAFEIFGIRLFGGDEVDRDIIDPVDYAITLDTGDADGALNAAEVGQAIKNVFMPRVITLSFVQSRGDEARFTELDADGDGSISMAEFGINPAQTGEMSMVSSTTTTTTYVNTAGETANGAEAIAGTDAAQALAAATGAPEAAAEPATVTAAADPLQELIGSVDSDGDGQISGAELNTFVAQLSSQLEAASKKYNDVALASASSSNTLDEAA